jgi:hypothetical protein
VGSLVGGDLLEKRVSSRESGGSEVGGGELGESLVVEGA